MNTIRTFLAFSLALMAAACGQKQAETDAAEASDEHHHQQDTVALTRQQMDAVGIKTGVMEWREMGTDISASGQLCLAATDRADVTTLVAGRVKSIAVAEGQNVAAGQVVAYIENTQIVKMQQSYLAARQEEMLAQSELARQRDLTAQGAGVERTLQQAEARCNTAVASRKALAASLRQIGINTETVESGSLATKVPLRSPIAGVVSRINVSLGSFVDVQSPLMQVAKSSAVYCQLNVYEGNISFVEAGQEAEIRLTGRPKILLKGRVRRINPAIDPATRALAVMVEITSGSTDGLAPGMYANGLIATGSHRVQALPDEAIASADGKSFIFVAVEHGNHDDKAHHSANDMADGSLNEANHADTAPHNSGQTVATQLFRRVEIVAGVASHGYTQVAFAGNPLPDDARIVTDGAFYLASMTAEHGEH